MAKLKEIEYERHSFLKLRAIPWFPEAANHPGIAEGGIYLLSGPPGGGKTTIALQIAVDLASIGTKVLYLSLEQSPSDLKHKIEKQIFPHRRGKEQFKEQTFRSLQEAIAKKVKSIEAGSEEQRVEENLVVDASVNGMESLPDFLARQVLPSTGPYYGSRLIVVDSIQGLGTAPTSAKPYQRLFEFNRWAKEDRIAVLLIGHITKGGAIAGPRSLEHNVDCVLYLRKAMRLRPLFVPKNRFGAERHEPLSLIMDDYGCLEKSKHVKAKASHAFGFLGGTMNDLIEVQALVKLPKYGDKPGIKAPYLPRQKLSQLVGIISAMQDIDISDLTFEINCALPGGRPYRETLDLPLAMSMLSSYFQREIPGGTLFLGELDLFQKVRPVQISTCIEIAESLGDLDANPLARSIRSIYVSEDNSAALVKALSDHGINIKVCAVRDLEHTLSVLWPEILNK